MTTKILRAAVLAAGLLMATEASARLAAPLIPTALVEDVKGATTDVEFMDYVGTGQVIKLQPGDVLVLSYLKSCEHETITGGTVTVGAERSEVQGGKIARAKVDCDGGKVELTSQEASKTAASVFRLNSVSHQPTLYARAPMIEVPPLRPEDSRLLVVERIDQPGERFEVKIDQRPAGRGFYDLAKSNKLLTPGATYRASVGDRRIAFKIDANAKSGKTPIIGRLLRFQ